MAMMPMSQSEIADRGQRFQEQAAGLMQLLASMEQSLARCAEQGVAPDALATFSAQQADFAAGAEELRRSHEQLQQRLADHAAELAAREAALAASRAELRQLTRRLVQVQEDERRALARDLHDTSGEAMTVLGLGLAMLQRESNCSEQTVARITQLREMTTTVGEDLHRLAVNLRPASLDRYGLVPALEELVRSVQQRTGVALAFEAVGLDDRIPGDVETALYRVVQEACTNIARYAEATHASVRLHRQADRVRVEVADDGRGFDVAEALERGRLGLVGMRERAEMLGGVFGIASRPGQGTRLWVEAPLPAPAASAPGFDRHAATQGDGSGPRAAAPAGFDPPAAPPAERSDPRGKALSDALVDIMAASGRQDNAQALLDFVLGASARGIGCDYAYVALRDASAWCIRHGYRIPETLLNQRLPDRDLPLAVEVERTRARVVQNPGQSGGALPHGLAHDLGAHAAAAIPLVAAGQFLGVVTYCHVSAADAFQPSEGEFLDRLAALVSLSLENLELHAAEAQQRGVLEAVIATVPVGIAVLGRADFDYKVANAAYRALTPHPEIDPAGRRYADIWPAAEGFDAGPAWLTRVLETGEPLDVDGHMRIFPDGSRRYFAFSVRRLAWSDGLAALVVLIDTTALEASAAAARQLAAERDAILSAINDGLVVYDMGGRIVRLNDVAQAILGYSDQQAGADFTRRVEYARPRRPDGQSYAFADFPAIRALRGETVQGAVLTLERTDAAAVWVSASAAPIYGPGGEQLGAVTTFTDITSLHAAQQAVETAHRRLAAAATGEQQAQAAAAESEAIYRAIARSFPEAGIYVFDHDLRFQVVEGELLAVLNHTREQMEGKTIWETLDPETAAVIEPRYRRALAGEALHFETRYGPRYGGRIISADYRPIYGEQGQVVAGLLVARDLSERSRLLAQMQGHVAELDAILSALPSGLIVYDHAGQLIRMNELAQAMLAYDESSWQRPVGERVTKTVQLSRPDGSPLEGSEYPALRALRGEAVRGESYFLHLPEHPERDFWVVLSASPLRGPDGEPLGAALTMTDVSDLHQARTRLQEVNAELRRQAAELQSAKDQLEQRVHERTAELAVLLDQMGVNRAQLKALSHRLVEMQERERSYVADQLYNQAAQVLAAVRMQMWLLEKHRRAGAEDDGLAGMKDALDQTILALHDLATQLRPAGLNRATLSRVLGDYVRRFTAQNGLAFRFDPGNAAEVRVSNEVVTAVFRTIQEAVANIVRHAQATEVSMTLGLVGGVLAITLSDNGVGFDPAARLIQGVGLVAMRERMATIGGRLAVASSGEGTLIRIEAPVN